MARLRWSRPGPDGAVTLEHVAHAAGVSVATVSRVVPAADLMAEAMKAADTIASMSPTPSLKPTRLGQASARRASVSGLYLACARL